MKNNLKSVSFVNINKYKYLNTRFFKRSLSALHCNFPGEIFHKAGFSLPTPVTALSVPNTCI